MIEPKALTQGTEQCGLFVSAALRQIDLTCLCKERTSLLKPRRGNASGAISEFLEGQYAHRFSAGFAVAIGCGGRRAARIAALPEEAGKKAGRAHQTNAGAGLGYHQKVETTDNCSCKGLLKKEGTGFEDVQRADSIQPSLHRIRLFPLSIQSFLITACKAKPSCCRASMSASLLSMASSQSLKRFLTSVTGSPQR